MSGEIVPFQTMDKGSLTAYLANPAIAAAAALNEDVSNFQSFPSISIKGKVFALVQGEERHLMMKPDAPDEVAQSLQMVILRANDKARTYYDKPYDENLIPPAKPTCYSNDNVAPSDLSIEKQSATCPTCKWAVFGTARKADGTAGKGTACQSNARLAVAAPDALDKPHMLRAPATSLRPLRDAIDVIRKRNIPYPLVVMKISFVPEEASPLLKFLPVGLLSQSDAEKALAMREDVVVRAICGLDERSAVSASTPLVAPPAAKEDLGAGLDAAIKQRAANPPTPPATPSAKKPTAAAEPKTVTPPAVVSANGGQPATASASHQNGQTESSLATSPTNAPVTVVSGELLGELGSLLGNLDG